MITNVAAYFSPPLKTLPPEEIIKLHVVEISPLSQKLPLKCFSIENYHAMERKYFYATL